jgi:glucose/arabinose dehydrogenase
MSSSSNAFQSVYLRQPSSKRRRWVILAVAGVVALGGLGYSLKGTGVVHAVRKSLGLLPSPPPPAPVIPVPSIASFFPRDASTGIDPALPVTFTFNLPVGPIDPSTVTDNSVGLFRVDNMQRVKARVILEGNQLTVRPDAPLEANRNYRAHLLESVKDVKGNTIKQKTFAFFTSSQPLPGVGFEQVPQMQTKGEGYTCLKIGPDGRLWAATHDGKLMRFPILDDGTLGPAETFNTLQVAEKGPRLCTGFTFDPLSTADAPIVYLTHSEFGFGMETPVTDYTGKVSRLSGPKLETIELLIENLPRSSRDHATNQPNFGPDGALYIPQPSNTATGGPDAFWYMREEHGLCATMLRLDVRAMPPGTPAINAKTTDTGGPFVVTTFKPGEANPPLTVYAYGLRMPYDVLWHSNGRMYSAINGASSGGSTPAGPNVPAVRRVNLAEHDWLFDVQPGQYYGHPNAAQGYYVLNGGNPTPAPDFNEVSDYPVGVAPDSRVIQPIYDLGMHISANGMVEITSGRFPELTGKIFICRYNVGSGLLCVGFAADGSVNYASGEIPGTQNLTGPLDVIEDPRTGNLYVAEYFERAPSETRITLLRATSPVVSAP